MTDFTFRRTTRTEEEMIHSNIKDKFGSEALKIFSQKQLWIKEGKIKEVFLIHEYRVNILEKLSEQIYSAGIPIGSMLENNFQLEIEGAYLILPYTDIKIKVKTNQFLYGKNIFVENVEPVECHFNKGDYLIIIGTNNLHYGIGKAEIGIKEIENAQPNTVLLKGLKNKPLDRGWYLRKGN